MTNGRIIIGTAAGILCLLGCSADQNNPESGETSPEPPPIVESVTYALNVDASCSRRGGDYAGRLRRMQTEMANLVWNAAYSYMDDPWSQWAWYSFSQPNYGQYQTVVDSLWTIALTLDSDRGFGGPITYDCPPTGDHWCQGTTTASAQIIGAEWRIHLCDSWDALKNFDSQDEEYGFELQRAALIHEFFHFLGYSDGLFNYCDCAIKTAWKDPYWGARTPDTYQLFINGMNGVPSICEIAPDALKTCAYPI
jgi:hypothetical protein